MSLSITVRNVGDVTVLDLSGRITLGEATGELRDAVSAEVAKNTRILLNLGGVSYIDSAGLGELVGCHTTVRNRGGELKMLNMQKRVRDLMQITRLLTVFESFDDEDLAVRSFSRAAGA